MADPAADLLALYRAVQAGDEVKAVVDLPKVITTQKGPQAVPYYYGVPFDQWPPEPPTMAAKVDTTVYRIWQAQLLINGEDCGFSETYHYATTGVGNPYEEVSIALAKMAQARRRCMSTDYSIVATRVSDVNVNADSQPHTGDKYGCGSGAKSGAVAPARDCFRILFATPDFTIKAIRHFGGCAVQSLNLTSTAKRSRIGYSVEVVSFADELNLVYRGSQQPSNLAGEINPVVEGYDRAAAAAGRVPVDSFALDAQGRVKVTMVGVVATFVQGSHVHVRHPRKTYIKGLAGDWIVERSDQVAGNTVLTLNALVKFPASSLTGLTGFIEPRVRAYYLVGDFRLFLYGRRVVGRPFFLDAGSHKGK